MLSAVGCWIGSVIGNGFYWLLIGATLGRFFPRTFGDGTSVIAIVVSLVGVGALHFSILGGVEEATAINKVVTVAKVVPLLVTIILSRCCFKYWQLRENSFGRVRMAEKASSRRFATRCRSRCSASSPSQAQPSIPTLAG